MKDLPKLTKLTAIILYLYSALLAISSFFYDNPVLFESVCYFTLAQILLLGGLKTTRRIAFIIAFILGFKIVFTFIDLLNFKYVGVTFGRVTLANPFVTQYLGTFTLAIAYFLLTHSTIKTAMRKANILYRPFWRYGTARGFLLAFLISIAMYFPVRFYSNSKLTLLAIQTAAEDRDSQAAFELGSIYEYGKKGINKNYHAAAKWYQIAANEGEIFAKRNLATMYADGKGVPQNMEKAVQLYKEASDSGDYIATYNLGLHFELGKGVKQDYQQAAKYYLLAAQHNIGCAQNDLGALYASGKGVLQNDEQATFWFQKAAVFGLNETGLNQKMNDSDKKNYIESFIKYRLASVKNLNIPENLPNKNIVKKISDHIDNVCRN